ncbi:hypothetical protein [Burkholderia catarinensis]|uniref:hypothetical protein n=1 Tax=Burkholderia catarinensis TaxID=1108140 RepID=UPI001FE40276|nr:hypothetical protein [Burkholderia catarinensis]
MRTAARTRATRRTCQAGTAPEQSTARARPARRPPDRPAARQPPLAPPGAEAAPGMLAPLSPLLAAAPLLAMPDGAVGGAADMPPAALDSELAPPPPSLFFWQPAPAARPAIRMPAKTARDT